MTLRPAAAASPIVVSGMVAERSLIGPYLQEIQVVGVAVGVHGT
jgi:hypothetical protein